VLTHRVSGVVNFAHAATGMYLAFAYFQFRDTGDLVLPVIGLPSRVRLLGTPTLATAVVVATLLAALLGALLYWVVFRPLRDAPPLAGVVASLGLMLYLQEVVRLNFGPTSAATVNRFPILPEDSIRLLGTVVSANRLLLCLLVVVTTAALTWMTRRTRFGLETSAVAANEKGALLIGVRPDRVGALNWILATVIAGAAVVLIEPIAGLDPTGTSLLVLPALAAALLGGLASFVVTAVAGIGIGVLQSVILGWSVRPGAAWVPDWVPRTGLQQAVPVLLVLLALVWRGDVLPDRTAVGEQRLPSSPTPRRVALWSALLGSAAVLWLLVVDAPQRQALIVTTIAALVALSVVVVTGYVGQISLAQLAIAGVAGFVLIDVAADGVPFPMAAALAVGVATVVGVLVGLPATRVRGMSLAIATLAAAVAIEQLVLASPALSGGTAGRSAARPSLFGLDLGVSARGADNFRPAFGVLCVVVLASSCALVANLRRNRTGLTWLAVRANERAAAAAGIDVAATKVGAFAVSSALAGAAGVLTAYSTTTLSTSSFVVIGALVALAIAYLGGIASISGALVAGCLAPAGLVTVLLDGGERGNAGTYVMAVSGLALIAAAILLPDGIAGALARRAGRRRSPSAAEASPTVGVASSTAAHDGAVG
jgi:branched-subunit amino acid ABC-type transport system permease component